MRLQTSILYLVAVLALCLGGCAADESAGSDGGATGTPDTGAPGADVGSDAIVADTAVVDVPIVPDTGNPSEDSADAGEPGDDVGIVDTGTTDAAVQPDVPESLDVSEDTSSSAGCCQSDAECGAETPRCVIEPGQAYGTCVVAASGQECWLDSDCAVDETCEGVAICSCNKKCALDDGPGTCKPAPLPAGCCFADDDCDLGGDMAFSCAFSEPGSIGLCVPLASGAGECWDSGDCAKGEHCEGATFCPCDTLCGQIQAPGSCKADPLPVPCVGECADPATTTCVGDIDYPDAGVDVPGKCMLIPGEGLCWEDSACSDTEVCVNAVYCPVGAACLVDEHPGVCLDALLTASGQCWADADCNVSGAVADPPAGMLACTGALVPALWTSGTAKMAPPTPGECCLVSFGECFEDNDCPVGEHCDGAVMPFTGACTDPLGDEVAGQCVPNNPWPEELCLHDYDCAPGSSCIGEWICPPGSLCIDPPYRGLCLTTGDACWEGAACDGGPCNDAWICDVLGGEMCGGAMATPGSCGPALGGVGDLCGQDGGDCQEGLACCYPCGIAGCQFKCAVPCDDNDPGCSGGCFMYP